MSLCDFALVQRVVFAVSFGVSGISQKGTKNSDKKTEGQKELRNKNVPVMF